MSQLLDLAAYELCVEVREGRSDEALCDVPNGQPAASADVIKQLETGCPGYSLSEYKHAIAKGMFVSR